MAALSGSLTSEPFETLLISYVVFVVEMFVEKGAAWTSKRFLAEEIATPLCNILQITPPNQLSAHNVVSILAAMKTPGPTLHGKRSHFVCLKSTAAVLGQILTRTLV